MTNISITNNTLMICPNSYKEVLLETFNKEKRIVDINFITLKEYKKNILYDYDIEAIKYIVDTREISVSNAKELIENTYYVDIDKNYDNEKLKTITQIKKELINNKLLKINRSFENYVNNKNVVVCGYGRLDHFNKSLIKGRNIEIIEEEIKEKVYEIHEFKDIEQEVEYVYNSISDLIEQGIDINNIYIVCNNSEYYPYYTRYNTYYNFKVIFSEDDSIYGTSIVKTFIDDIDNKNRQEIYDGLIENNGDIANKLINTINKYAKYELSQVKEFIIEDIKNTKIENNKYKDVVRCINISDIRSDAHVFVMGFNENVPNSIKDNQYITNNLRKILGLQSIEEENDLLKHNTKIHLSNINNLFLSYCENSPFNTYNKQYLFSDDEVVYVNNIDSYTYSDGLNKVKYGFMLDRLSKYGHMSDNINVLYKTYAENNYLEYDNKFKQLTDEQKNNKVVLSYSSMNSYNECAFKYYIENILNITEFTSTYYSKLGSLCYEVLKDLYTSDDFDFDKSWNNNLEKLTVKEKEPLLTDEISLFFLNKIKEELLKDIDIIKQQKAESTFDKVKCENKFEVDVNDNIKFKGYIDKIMYKVVDDHIYASIIDYKTGSSQKIDERLMEFGLSLQLPSYLYLLRNDEMFKDAKFAGIYLQHIINNNNKYEQDKTLNDLKKESMKLAGFSSSDIDRTMAFDTSLINNNKSENIESLKLKKDGGFNLTSKVKSDEQFEDMINIVETQINTVGESILNGDFNINPKIINNINVSCKYCKYKDICFKRVNDLNYLSIKEEEDEAY